MKKVFFISILIISLFIVKSDLLSQSFCYNQQGCEGWVYEGGPHLIYIPEFPTCSLFVWYHTRVCNGVTQIWISRVQANFESGCDDLFDCIYPEGFNGPPDWGCVANVWESVYSQVSWLYFLSETSGMSDLEKDEFLCGSGKFVKTHTYFRDICRKFCLKFEVVGPSDYNIYVVENICTNEYCCQIEKKYCYNKFWDPGQGKFVYFPNVEEVRTAEAWVDCDEIEPVPAPCPEGYLEVSPCRASCEIPE